MGCASSTSMPPSQQPQNNNGNGNGAAARRPVQTAPAGSIGNSIPLQEPQRWSSKKKISRQQLEGKREEFWHTCQATNVPAVWQQLRTVCEVMASGDIGTASAICQAANIITPEGSLTRCYDQFGNLVSLTYFIILLFIFLTLYYFATITATQWAKATLHRRHPFWATSKSNKNTQQQLTTTISFPHFFFLVLFFFVLYSSSMKFHTTAFVTQLI